MLVCNVSVLKSSVPACKPRLQKNEGRSQDVLFSLRRCYKVGFEHGRSKSRPFRGESRHPEQNKAHTVQV